MKKITGVIGETREKFTQRRKVPRLPLIVVAIVTGAVGAYALISSFAATDGSITFQDSFESGSFDSSKWYVQALPGRVSILSNGAADGSKYAHFEVDEGDKEPNTGSSRAEISGPTFNDGQELYIKDSIRIPSQVSYSGNWQIIQQLHETNWSSSPGTAVFLSQTPQLSLGPGSGSPTYWTSPTLQHDKWYTLTYHIKLSQDPSIGFIEVWFDGTQQKLTNGQTRMYNKTIQASQTYLKAGIYRAGTSTGTSLIDHDNITIGTSYDTVAGTPPSAPPPTTTPPPPTSTDTTVPQINFTAPYPGNKISGPVPLSVIATDNVGVSQVEFYVDGQKIGTDTSKPYTANWDSTGAAAGNHTFTAKAYDAGGNVGTASVTAQLITNPPIASGVPKDGNVELGLKDSGTPFAPGSFANLQLPNNTPINPNTDAYINNLRNFLGQKTITLNTNMWSTPLYVVPSGQPYTAVKLYCSDGSAANGKPGFVSNVLTGGIPIPPNAHSAAGTDESITIYQPSTGKEWELWRLQKDSNGEWEACWGGRIDNVSQSDGIFTFPYGSSASGLPHLGNIPRIEELQAGHIDHVVNLTLPDLAPNLMILKSSIPPANTPGATKGYSWPANRSDGKSDDPLAIAEGQRFRLPANLDLSQYKLTPVARVIAEAVQKYGLMVDDGGGDIGIRLGDPTPYTAAGYANPYVTGPGVGGTGSSGLFEGLPTYQIMKNFPWDKLQALPYDYGKSAGGTSDGSISDVSFTAPVNNATVSGIVTATATTNNNANVSKVELSLDGALKITDIQAPYSYSFDSRTLANGAHTLTAKAYDKTGASKTATITVTASNVDVAPPSAPSSVKATAVNATTASLSWAASLDSGNQSSGVAKYNVLRDGTVIGQTSDTEYVDNSCVAGMTYHYTVQAVDGAGNVSANSNSVSLTMPETSAPLTWAPPELKNPKIVYLDTTKTFLGPYAPDQDVLIIMPDQTRTRKLDVEGGRNVRVIGGAIASNSSSDTFMLRFQQVYGSVFVEGLTIDGSGAGPADGIDVYGPAADPSVRPDVYIQNTRIVNIHGSLASVHADCFQPQGAVGRIRMDHVTCKSDYQGLFIPPQHSIGSADLRNINLAYTDPANATKVTYLLWLTGILGDSTNNCTTYPINLSHVYIEPRNTQNIGTQAVWPKTNQPASCPSLLQNGTLSFPALNSLVKGTVSSGKPPSGDFALAGAAGLGYVSPGYGASPALDTSPPSVPAGVTAATVSPTQINLTWKPSYDAGGSGLAGYNIYRDGRKLNELPIEGTVFGDSTAKEGTSYSYQVEAIDGAGNISGKTAPVHIQTANIVAPKTDSGGGTSPEVQYPSAGKIDRKLRKSRTSQPAVSEIELSVSIENDRPAAGATVSLAGQTTKTDSTGKATFANVPTGQQAVTSLYKGKRSTATINVQRGIFEKWPEFFNVSIARHEVNPLPVIVPLAVMVAAASFIIRPWNSRLQAKLGLHVVTQGDPPDLNQKADKPGNVYRPEGTDSDQKRREP